ncbi:MAG TPA: type II secretion system minor pseudopilin GspJ [Steroidobacteraceae bacterium]|nr:type II secretion system minor pseudopilin GspJ [Steroidobacteraceae bacterium]
MRRTGFTLMEVMIAMFIAAIMLALGYSAINQAAKDRTSLETSQARITEIQRGMRVVAQDFAQMIARTARDTEGGGNIQAAVIATNKDDTLITFSRAGWSNPAGVQRPAEQRVRYRFIDGSLVREHWLSLDSALNAEPRQRIVLTKIKEVQLRFLDPVSRNWRDDWPASTPNGPVDPSNIDLLLRTRPLAIELTVVFDDWGRIQRLFEIPS